jgi:hypothetical protein
MTYAAHRKIIDADSSGGELQPPPSLKPSPPPRPQTQNPLYSATRNR